MLASSSSIDWCIQIPCVLLSRGLRAYPDICAPAPEFPSSHLRIWYGRLLHRRFQPHDKRCRFHSLFPQKFPENSGNLLQKGELFNKAAPPFTHRILSKAYLIRYLHVVKAVCGQKDYLCTLYLTGWKGSAFGKFRKNEADGFLFRQSILPQVSLAGMGILPVGTYPKLTRESSKERSEV